MGTPPEGRRFKPGQSGNPNGRPKKTVKLAEYCRDLTPQVVLVLEDALNVGWDKDGKPVHLSHEQRRERMEAAKLILAYGHGRPVQMQHVRVIRGLQDLTEEELIAIAGSEPEDEEEDGEADDLAALAGTHPSSSETRN
jgi:Family of unknown function (DUF5681)